MPLVQPRRLVFRKVDDNCWQADSGYGTFEVWQDGEWCWEVFASNGNKIANGCGHNTQADAVEFAQAWLNERWLADTEVPELVWDGADAGVGYWYSGNYGIEHNEFEELPFTAWWEDTHGQSEQIGEFVTFEAAKAACNQHNRRAVLGEQT